MGNGQMAKRQWAIGNEQKAKRQWAKGKKAMGN
jgi:hypothetical protein